MYTPTTLLASALALAPLTLAKTDLTGCTPTQLVVYGGASMLYYVPGTGEICSFLDCGGGMAPPKTTVLGCPLYSGTATYSPSYYTAAVVAETTAATATAAVSSPAVTSIAVAASSVVVVQSSSSTQVVAAASSESPSVASTTLSAEISTTTCETSAASMTALSSAAAQSVVSSPAVSSAATTSTGIATIAVSTTLFPVLSTFASFATGGGVATTNGTFSTGVVAPTASLFSGAAAPTGYARVFGEVVGMVVAVGAVGLL